jgi:uncharacterized surface protein with fasciclin (FAS1) repeats
MKNKLSFTFVILFFSSFIYSCNSSQSKIETNNANNAESSAPAGGGQSTVKDDVSQKNIVQVASGSADHTTLVSAVAAAELVDALSNAGPFTVFAPTNAAFDKLPKGTVEDLLTPEKKESLQNILQYHVSVAVYKLENLSDGQLIGQVNGDNVTIHVKDGKTMVNDANIIASIPASNGIIHVIDAVLLPPAPTAGK